MRTIHIFRVAAFAATFLVGLNSASHAQTDDSAGILDLPLVSPESVPATGTFFLLSTFETNQFRFGFAPPFPYNPLGDQADVFLLGSNFLGNGWSSSFVVDDTSYVPLSANGPMTSGEIPPLPGDGSGDTNQLAGGGGPPFAPLLGPGLCDDYGKRFWFSSITLTSGTVRLTLTNTVSNFVYTIDRATTLGNPTAWTQVQTFTATGFVAVASPISVGASQSGFFRATLASDPLGLGWTTNLFDAPISSSAATAGDCTVFVSAAGHLYALDFAQGAIKWTKALDNTNAGDVAPSPALAADGSAVFVASQNGAVLALRPADGGLLWSNYLGNSIFSSPAISAADGTVYIATDSGSPGLLALNPATGATNWVFQPNDPVLVGFLSDASVAVGPDCTIYLVATSGDLYAVHPDGSLAWFFPFPAGSAPQSSPAIDSAGQIVVGSADGYVYCLSPLGGLRWLFSTGDGQAVSSPAIGADSTVYAATTAGNLFAITNGVLRWKYTAPSTNQYGLPASFISSPAVNSNNVVFIGSVDNNGHTLGLFAVSNGVLQTFYPTAGGIIGSPVIARDSVIIADLAGYVYKFPGAGYPAASAPWPQFRLNSFHAGATPTAACASGHLPFAFPNNPNMTSDGAQFSFYLTGTPDTAWGIFVSTNLTNWSPVGAVGLDAFAGTTQFTDPTVAGVTNRFYRAHCGPYCTRIIGFINQSIQPGTNLIANQLFQVNDGYYPQNTAKGWTDLLIGLGEATPPDGTEVRKWNGVGFESGGWNKLSGQWVTNGDLTLLPGQAFFAITPSNQPVTLPFMGLLAPEPASNSIATGGSFLSSILPKAGRIHTDLGFNPNDGDKVLLWQTNHYATNTWLASTGWSSGEPSLRVGEGFLLLTSASNNWVAVSPTCPSEIVVPSRPLWTDSCLTVTNGDVIHFPTAGTWSPEGSTVVGPNGDGSTSAGFLAPAAWASLIAFVGPNPYRDDQGNNRWQDGTGYFPRPNGTNYYFVGAAGVFTNALRPGKLWFGFNDDAGPGTMVNDNSGFVHGTLQITHP